MQYTAVIQHCVKLAGGNPTLAAQKLCAAAENDLGLYQALTRPFLASAAALAVQQAVRQTPVKKNPVPDASSIPSDGVPWDQLLTQIARTSPLSPEQQAKNLRQVAKAFMVQRYTAYAQNPSIKPQHHA